MPAMAGAAADEIPVGGIDMEEVAGAEESMVDLESAGEATKAAEVCMGGGGDQQGQDPCSGTMIEIEETIDACRPDVPRRVGLLLTI
jgi:hypothetical protein